MTPTPVSGMAAVISAIGDVVTAAAGWIGTFVSTITKTGNEILLIGIIVSFVGLGIGLIRRIMGLN